MSISIRILLLVGAAFTFLYVYKGVKKSRFRAQETFFWLFLSLLFFCLFLESFLCIRHPFVVDRLHAALADRCVEKHIGFLHLVKAIDSFEQKYGGLLLGVGLDIVE